MRTKDLVYALEEIYPGNMDVGEYEEWLEGDHSAREAVELIIDLADEFKSFNEYLKEEQDEKNTME